MGRAPFPFSPRCGGRDKKGFGDHAGNLWFLLPPYPAEVSSVASYSTVGSIPNPRGPRQPSAPAQRTRDPLWPARLTARQEAAHLQLHDFGELTPVSVHRESQRAAVCSAADAKVTE